MAVTAPRSVAGRWAADVARDALELGRHVFLYSDNVSLEQEAELKRVGRAKGLLVLGPDCGTTILGGVNLGFANRVRRGAIGLVGASGTGLQMVTSHIHRLGGGVSHALGTGGRDLQDAIGGSTALQSLDLLARDPETRVLVLVSKPPDAAVAARLLGAAQGLGKPVVAALLGYAPPARRLGNVYFSAGLDDAAELAVRLASAGSEAPITAASTSNGRLFLRGLFSGGTLAYEALLALRTRLAEVRSNVSLPGIASLDDPTTSLGNTVVDLGDDALTVGRLHPMMDPDACRRRLRQEAADPEVASILLDIVLGDGAHPDPAGELAPVLAEIRDADGPPVTVLVVGTDDDPQGLDGQIERLEAAGAAVFRTTAEAVEHAVAAIPTPARTADSASHPPVSLDALASPLAAINVGVEAFHQTLLAGGAEAVQVAWRPPAGGNEKLRALLEKMKR